VLRCEVGGRGFEGEAGVVELAFEEPWSRSLGQTSA
jgi:hypothetical protein